MHSCKDPAECQRCCVRRDQVSSFLDPVEGSNAGQVLRPAAVTRTDWIALDAEGLPMLAWWAPDALELGEVRAGDLTAEALRALGWVKHRFATSHMARSAVAAFGPSCLSVAAWTDAVRLTSLDWESAMTLHDAGVAAGAVLPCGGQLWTALKGPLSGASPEALGSWIEACRLAPHPTANIGDQMGAWASAGWTPDAATAWLRLGCTAPEVAERWIRLGHTPESAGEYIRAAEIEEWANPDRLVERWSDAGYSDAAASQRAEASRQTAILRVQERALESARS